MYYDFSRFSLFLFSLSVGPAVLCRTSREANIPYMSPSDDIDMFSLREFYFYW